MASSTCQAIVRSAWRKSGIVAAGTFLSTLQLNIGMENLIDMYLGWLGAGMFGKLRDFYLPTGANWPPASPLPAGCGVSPLVWVRIYQSDPTSTITLPITLPSYGPSGVIQVPDGAFIEVTNPNAETPILADYLYDSSLGWINLQGLTLNSIAPLSARHVEAIKANLACILADEGGFPPPPGVMKQAAMGKLSIATRYDSVRRQFSLEWPIYYDYGFNPYQNSRGSGKFF